MAKTHDYSATFLQFDICLLQDAFKVSKKILSEKETDAARLQHIISYSLKRIGDHFDNTIFADENINSLVNGSSRYFDDTDIDIDTITKLDYAQAKAKSKLERGKEMPSNFDPTNVLHLQLWRASEMANVSIGSITHTIDRYTAAAQYIDKWRERTGKADTFTRIGIKNVFWSAVNGSLPFRHFAVVCAINANLTHKKVAQVTLKHIHAQAHGYRSSALFQASGAKERWSEDQIRRTVDNVCDVRGFFRKHTDGRAKYFSLLPADLFATEMQNRLSIKAKKQTKAKQLSNSISSNVKAMKAQLAESETPQVLKLYTGDSMYSMEFLATKYTDHDELNNLIRTATEIDWSGAKYYCFSRMPKDTLQRILIETLQRRAYGVTDEIQAAIDKLEKPYRK